jgi:DNA-binding GntR family transcriptional regulator
LEEGEKMDRDQSEDATEDHNQSYNNVELGRAESIVETLETEIREGRLREGEKLPSERELAARFKFARMTVRRALQILVSEGQIVSHPVRGYFVTNLRKRLLEYHGESIHADSDTSSVLAEELRQSGSFLKDMERRKRKPKIVPLENTPALVAPDEEVAEHLRLNTNQLVLRRYRLQLADGLPYRLIESFYPADLFGELIGIDIGEKPLFTWLQESYGLKAKRAREVLIARLATTLERRLLHLSPGMPIVAYDRTVWANTDRPIEWAHITAAAGLYTFMYDYDIQE